MLVVWPGGILQRKHYADATTPPELSDVGVGSRAIVAPGPADAYSTSDHHKITIVRLAGHSSRLLRCNRMRMQRPRGHCTQHNTRQPSQDYQPVQSANWLNPLSERCAVLQVLPWLPAPAMLRRRWSATCHRFHESAWVASFELCCGKTGC